MTHITVPDQSPFLEVVVSTVQTAFPFTFTFFDQTDLRVTVGSVELAQSAFTVVGTAGFEGGYPGGTVNLNVGVTDTIVRIWSEMPPVRVNDFLEGAGFPSRAINTELDRLTARQRDMRLRLQRTPVLAFSGTSKTLAAADAGQIFTNDEKTATFTYTLPAASAGLIFPFAVLAAHDLIVATQDDDLIAGAASITGSALGDYLELIALDDTTWAIRSKNGIWS